MNPLFYDQLISHLDDSQWTDIGTFLVIILVVGLITFTIVKTIDFFRK